MSQSIITVALTFSLVLVSLLSACGDSGDALERIQSRGELKVATRNSPTTYYLDRDGPNGFEYALAGLLAADLGVDLEIEPAFTLDGLFQLLDRGEADLAAAGLTLTEQRAGRFPHSSAYYKLRPQVVYVAGTERPLGVEDLPGRKIVVLADSSHVVELTRLRDEAEPALQ